MQWIVRFVLVFVLILPSFTLTFAYEDENRRAKELLDDAIQAWYENIEAVGDYVVEYQGNCVDSQDELHFITDFSGRTMRRDHKIRTERVVKFNRPSRAPIRAGMLFDGKDQYVIEGFYDNSVLRKLRPDKPERLRYDFEVDPFYLIPGGVHTETSSSVFRTRAHHLHSMHPINAFEVKLGIAAVFESKTPHYYRIIRFNRKLGWMPDLCDTGVYVNDDGDSPPDGDDLSVTYTHRLLWKELEHEVFVPVFYERVSPKYKKTTQIAFDWSNHDRAEAEFFTARHLESSHRMHDFGYSPLRVLRSSVPGVGLKEDWLPIDDGN